MVLLSGSLVHPTSSPDTGVWETRFDPVLSPEGGIVRTGGESRSDETPSLLPLTDPRHVTKTPDPPVPSGKFNCFYLVVGV